jgi:integration host factor subunit beta
MIKSELISQIAQKLTHISEKDLADSVNVMLEQMSDSLCKSERIEIRGFGSFALHYRPPRNAHNPKSGERLITTAKYSPHFKPGKEMRERINQSASHCPIIEVKDDE